MGIERLMDISPEDRLFMHSPDGAGGGRGRRGVEGLAVRTLKCEPTDLVTGELIPLADDQFEPEASLPIEGVYNRVLIPKDDNLKRQWVQGIMARIEKSDADIEKDPRVVRQYNDMVAVVTYLSSDEYLEGRMRKYAEDHGGKLPSPDDPFLTLGMDLYKEIVNRKKFYQKFSQFAGEITKAEQLLGVVGGVDGDILNFLIHSSDIRYFLTFFQKNASWYDLVDEGDPTRNTVDKARKFFREAAKAYAVRDVESGGRGTKGMDVKNREWASNLGERFWAISGSRISQVVTREVIASDGTVAYKFPDGISKGNEVYEKILRPKEFAHNERDKENLGVIWEPLMNGVDLGQRDFIAEIISRHKEIRDLTTKEMPDGATREGVDIRKAVVDRNTWSVMVQMDGESDDAFTDRLARDGRIDFTLLPDEEWKRIDFNTAIIGSSMEHWVVTKIIGPENAREALMGKSSSFLRDPNPKSLSEAADAFNHLKKAKALKMKAQLGANFVNLAMSDEAKEAGLRKIGLLERDLADTLVNTVAKSLGLDKEYAHEIFKKTVGKGILDRLLLGYDYFRADKFFIEFLFGLILGALQEAANIK